MNPAGLVTLLELLRFYAEVYVSLAKRLQDLQLCLAIDESEKRYSREPEDSKDYSLSVEDKHEALGALETAKIACEKIGLEVSLRHTVELINKAHGGYLGSNEVEALHQNIERELGCRFYVGVSQDRKAAYCDSLRGWEEIVQVFPEATEDIEEMNKCYALCRYSAAVFHSLLAVEHGLVKLGGILGVSDPKEGWDASCRKLESIVKAGRNANTTSLDFAFLEQLNTCVQAMKLAWRNKVNHATGKPIVMSGGFAPYVAEEIIAATRGFMRRLAEGIK